MPLLYCVVARGSTVLSRYASCAGNFSEVTEQILGKISPDVPKLTYSHGSYLFHYILEDGITYLTITDDSVTFRKSSRNLARSMMIKNIKIAIIIAVIVLVVIYIIVSSACGGLSWPSCV
ncbi:hypothetical protein HPB52_016204 [Rhipicephalus sanguineus]|uniref:Longin domain-containing protein n=1 Tax=Rhipicephalus sanguineus TaxID=34632 RepID=A0A9D4QDT9_RHISA|nr:hypothetical protein HPB52_016204 [Rhipicephalus sanguineus]